MNQHRLVPLLAARNPSRYPAAKLSWSRCAPFLLSVWTNGWGLCGSVGGAGDPFRRWTWSASHVDGLDINGSTSGSGVAYRLGTGLRFNHSHQSGPYGW
jgi:hypothetical protein